MKKQIGIIGLGKMGSNIGKSLLEKGWEVVGYNRSREDTDAFVEEGGIGAYSYDEFVNKLQAPRVVWVMVPSGDPADSVLSGEEGILPHLEQGDFLIDAGNSNYKKTLERSHKIEEKGVRFIDCGVSGGPEGARNGACLMIGGNESTYESLKELWQSVAAPDAFQFFNGVGAGHFVKMIHNGIEYGMMQSIAEGFDILKNSEYSINLEDAARVYGQKSVIDSKLIHLMYKAFKEYGQGLDDVTGSATHSGEGEWSIQTAHEKGIEVPVIESSLKVRNKTIDNPSFQGKVIMALRNLFGGHSI
jgi:6-phosphogluconate dehydrogenase